MTDRPPVIALTGGTGFVGSTLIDLALARGITLNALTRTPRDDRPGLSWITGTLEDRDALDRLCSGADVVVHVAGAVNAPDRKGFDRANRLGTQNMIDAARRSSVPRFVHVSSLAAREPALSDYGWSKAEAENCVTASDLHWSIVRPPAIYGPRDTEMLDLFRMAQRGLILLPPHGRMSAIHVADLATLLLALAMSDTADGKVLEADDARPGAWTHAEFAGALAKAVGRPARALHMPGWLVRLAARADRLARGTGAKLTPDRARYMVHDDWTADPAKQPPPSLWTPAIDTVQGLADTVAWYREQGWL